jgi:GTPase
MLKLAIVGRPNVGKSTLFNRLVGKRIALVDDTPGVTRDRREAAGRLGDLELQLVDTAGFDDVRDASLEARMRAQTQTAVDQADVVLFLIDARAGVTPLDESFAALLRRADKPVVLAANKCEGKAGEAGLNDAFGLGLGEPIALSAEHGEGLADLYKAIAAFEPSGEGREGRRARRSASGAAPRLPARPLPPPEEEGDADPANEQRSIKLAVIGRPNAGKSTLVNALLGDERVLTGPEAGITRDAIAIDWSWGGKSFRLTDTAGMRRKAKVQEKLEKLSVGESLHAIRFADVCVLVMDAREAFEKQDLSIADLCVREGRALVYALAKWDLVEGPKARLEELKLVAAESLPQARGAPIVTLSAIAGIGLDRLMKAVMEAHTDWSARVKTSDLNNWLQSALERHPPPAVRGKRIKPRYIAQIKARPPTFVLISSRASDLPDSYKRYLVNGLREAFDLHASPVRLIVKQNKNPYVDEKSG